VPLREWFSGELKSMVHDMFRSQSARSRPFVNTDAVLANFESAGRFSRKLWGLLSLELWHQQFHDQAHRYRAMLERSPHGSEPVAD
jgi:asparagine synthase (glutamine-hydrolysing)